MTEGSSLIPRDDKSLALLLWELTPSFTLREFTARCRRDELPVQDFHSLREVGLVEFRSKDNFGVPDSDPEATFRITHAGRKYIFANLPAAMQSSIRRGYILSRTGLPLLAPIVGGLLLLPVVLRAAFGWSDFAEPLGDLAVVVGFYYLAKLAVELQLKSDPWRVKHRANVVFPDEQLEFALIEEIADVRDDYAATPA